MAQQTLQAGGFEIDIVVQGYPGKSVCHGGLGWSTVALIRSPGHDLPMLQVDGVPQYPGEHEAAIRAWFDDDLEQTTLFRLNLGAERARNRPRWRTPCK